MPSDALQMAHEIWDMKTKVRNDALEQAARACEIPLTAEFYDLNDGLDIGRRYAAIIRALKETPA